MIGQTSLTAFIMTLPINITDGRSLSNKAHCELLSKKSKGYAVFPIHYTVKGVYPAVITRQSASVLKVGVPCGLQSL